MWRAPILALIALAVSLVTWNAHADSALVVLVRPPGQSALVAEAITRIRGELVADGFEVSVVDAGPDASPASVLARADQHGSAAATLGLFLSADATSAELWVVDRLTSKTVVRKVELTDSSAGHAPEVLARRSVELLRASLLEILVDAREKPAEKPGPRTQASRWVAQSLEPPPPRWAVEAGAQLLGVSGIGGAVMPVARVRFAFNQRIGARLTVAGLGTRPSVESAAGSASVSQGLALLELVGELTTQGWARPFVSVGAGSYHIGVDGSATSPYVGLSDDSFVFAADAGAGLALMLSSAFSLALEGHATVVTPYPVIRFLEADAVEVGNPLLSATLTVVGRL